MDARLQKVFSEHLRISHSGSGQTSDGRRIPSNSKGLEIAERLISADAENYADEIIKLMKPYCRPFDVESVRGRLLKMGKRQRAARKSVAPAIPEARVTASA